VQHIATHRAVDDLEAAGACIDTCGGCAVEAPSQPGLKGFGTGTAELLASSVPLLTDLGLDCHWQVVRTSEDSAHAHNAMYKALGGATVMWTQEMTAAWLRAMEMNADLLTEPFDVVIVHDPQPAAIRSFVEDGGGHVALPPAPGPVGGAGRCLAAARSHIVKYRGGDLRDEETSRRTSTCRVHRAAGDRPEQRAQHGAAGRLIRTILKRHGVDLPPLVCQVSVRRRERPCRRRRYGLRLRDRFPDSSPHPTTRPQDVSVATYDGVARCCIDKEDVFVLGMGGEFGSVETQPPSAPPSLHAARRGFGLWVRRSGRSVRSSSARRRACSNR
jgi:hypothetical protein